MEIKDNIINPGSFGNPQNINIMVYYIASYSGGFTISYNTKDLFDFELEDSQGDQIDLLMQITTNDIPTINQNINQILENLTKQGTTQGFGDDDYFDQVPDFLNQVLSYAALTNQWETFAAKVVNFAKTMLESEDEDPEDIFRYYTGIATDSTRDTFLNQYPKDAKLFETYWKEH